MIFFFLVLADGRYEAITVYRELRYVQTFTRARVCAVYDNHIKRVKKTSRSILVPGRVLGCDLAAANVFGIISGEFRCMYENGPCSVVAGIEVLVRGDGVFYIYGLDFYRRYDPNIQNVVGSVPNRESVFRIERSRRAGSFWIVTIDLHRRIGALYGWQYVFI